MDKDLKYIMEIFIHHFSVSGVETYIFLPPLIMFIVSMLTSTAGVSGAFILLPFQMSVLGYTSPGVSATNFVYNIVSIPSGVFHHIQRGRLSWTLFSIIVLGTLPGVFIGYYIRMVYLPDPAHFRLFVGLVLIYLGIRTLKSAYKDFINTGTDKNNHKAEVVINREITNETFGILRTSIVFDGKTYSFSTPLVLFVSAAVGIVGGAYGIGGGAIMAPFCISVLELPVYIVSGAALFSTWTTSVIAVMFYAFVSIAGQAPASPDWFLGILFGLGGMGGIYVGARIQKWIPSTIIKLILGIVIFTIAVRYILLSAT